MLLEYNGTTFLDDIGKPPSRTRYHLLRNGLIDGGRIKAKDEDVEYLLARGFTAVDDDAQNVSINAQTVSTPSHIVSTNADGIHDNSQSMHSDSQPVHEDTQAENADLHKVDNDATDIETYSQDLDELTRPQLIEHAKMEGVNISGTKAEIKERLRKSQE